MTVNATLDNVNSSNYNNVTDINCFTIENNITTFEELEYKVYDFIASDILEDTILSQIENMEIKEGSFIDNKKARKIIDNLAKNTSTYDLEVIVNFESFEEHEITDFNDLIELELTEISDKLEMLFNLQTTFEESENQELENKITDLKATIEKEINDAVEELENKIEELEQEQEEPQEPLEWWLVTNYFADELRKHNEPILDNDYGIYWGRCTSGQAILLDSVISEIAISREILEGQKNSWHDEPEIPEVPNNNGYSVIDFTQFPHKDDYFLYIVLAYNSSKNEYCTWIYNKNDDAFNNGHYLDNKIDAFNDYAERMNQIF